MQPEVPQPPQSQPTAPVGPAATAFQSTVPHPPVQAVNPAMMSPLPPAKKGIGGLLVIICLVLALLASLGFGVWAFMEMQNYKNNSDQISATAVEAALTTQKTQLDAEFAEKEKLPYDTYTGTQASGSLSFNYPRTWSAYIIEGDGSKPVEGYLHPGFVPGVRNNTDVAFALKVEVSDDEYSSVLQQYQSLVSQGGLTIAPYTFASVPGSLGVILRGEIVQGNETADGTMVIMPIRDKTLRIWTESNSAFAKDFNETILPSLTFIP